MDPVISGYLGATPTLICLFEDDETRWHALQTRNANADGFFVYAVRTTRIYCRPTCKARLARRANVSFYATPSEAQEAGFRACKRCKPDVAGFMPEEAAVRKIRAFVNGEGRDDDGEWMSLGQMARRTGLSKWHFHRVFKNVVGITPVEYVRFRRKRSRDQSAPVLSDELSPGDSAEMDWLQQLGSGQVDLEELGSLLPDGIASAESTSTGDSLEAPLTDDIFWKDLLIFPDD